MVRKAIAEDLGMCESEEEVKIVYVTTAFASMEKDRGGEIQRKKTGGMNHHSD